ncbi:hypothetical protein EYF80_041311 [Liparis tanakae]|uniref:Uncharacterized protein n=1 Tax=Liparis tanakae TaxID=230148 RepID=A0A4Z2G5S3_9TELE|nr:hypothetical protein EYF80_041311 [Liparis tanakae]
MVTTPSVYGGGYRGNEKLEAVLLFIRDRRAAAFPILDKVTLNSLIQGQRSFHFWAAGRRFRVDPSSGHELGT